MEVRLNIELFLGSLVIYSSRRKALGQCIHCPEPMSMNGLCSVRKLGSNVLVLQRYFSLVFVHCKLVSLAICLVILGFLFFFFVFKDL